VSLPVLQPVRRHRRRRSRLPQLLIVAFFVCLLALTLGWRFARGGGGQRAGTNGVAATKPRAPSAQPVAARQPNLLPGPALVSKPFDPLLSARAAIVVSAQTGRVIWAAAPTLRLPIASTTKVMTAHLVLEHLPLNTIVRVDPGVTRVPLVKEGLRPGERVPAWKLLDGLLLYSGNDDALALAVATSGSRPAFVRLMNAEAQRLKLRNTHFRGPSGVIDRDNYSTAADLAALTRVALRDSRFRAIVRRRIARVTWAAPTYAKVYLNKNRLLSLYRGADGVKTGWTTEAGHCLIASATRNHETLIAVVLHSDHPYNDAARLLNLGFRTPA
jgi:D-alanyl-D-alanine carboxypeptidase (penicillin-binding protein 5/6)